MTPAQLATLEAAAIVIELNAGDHLAAEVRAIAVDARAREERHEAGDTEHLAMLKRVRNELQACQAVIHLAGGFDPRYVSDAQAALKELDATIFASQQRGG